jgi:hypothetical protein
MIDPETVREGDRVIVDGDTAVVVSVTTFDAEIVNGDWKAYPPELRVRFADGVEDTVLSVVTDAGCSNAIYLFPVEQAAAKEAEDRG